MVPSCVQETRGFLLTLPMLFVADDCQEQMASEPIPCCIGEKPIKHGFYSALRLESSIQLVQSGFMLKGVSGKREAVRD